MILDHLVHSKTRVEILPLLFFPQYLVYADCGSLLICDVYNKKNLQRGIFFKKEDI